MRRSRLNIFRNILGALCVLMAPLSPLALQPVFAQVPATQPTTENSQHSNAAAPTHWIGVMVQKIPTAFSSLLGLNADQGLFIVQVIPKSPAAKAGLAAGDLLIQINNQPASQGEALVRAVNIMENGKPASCLLTYIRDGVRHSINIVPEDRPANLTISPIPGSLSGLTTSNTVLRAGNIYIQGAQGAIAIGPGVILHLEPNPNQNTPNYGVVTIEGLPQPNPGTIPQGSRVVVNLQSSQESAENAPATGTLTIQGRQPMQVTANPVLAQRLTPQEYISLLKIRIVQLQGGINQAQMQLAQLQNRLEQMQAAQITPTAAAPTTTAPSH